MRVTRAVLRTAGRPVLLRALAVASGVGALAAVLFGPTGLAPSLAVSGMQHSALSRAVSYGAWCLLAGPALSAAFDAPGTRVLRSLRAQRSAVLLALLALALLVELPWGALYVAGAGPAAGASAVLLAIALQSSWFAGFRHRRYAVLAALAVLVLLVPLPAWLTLSAAAPLAVRSLAAAWDAALESRGQGRALVPRTHPIAALATAHLLRVGRVARARLSVALASTALGAAAVALAFVNEPPLRPLQRALEILALPLGLAASVLVAPLLESEASMRAALRSTRTRPAIALAAFLLALSLPSSALAATAAGAAGALSHQPVPPLATGSLLFGGALAAALGLWQRRQHATRRQNPALLFAGSAAIVLLALAAVASC